MNKPHICKHENLWCLKVPLYRLPWDQVTIYKIHGSCEVVGSYLFSFTEFNYLLTFLKYITYRVN